VSDLDLDCEVVVTRSGVRAVLDRLTGEVMHPVVGPQVEAEALYLGPSRLLARLLEPTATPLVLLDVGLGAGSNALAAWRLSESLPPTVRRLEIVSFDRSLAALRLASRPEHAAAFGCEGPAGVAIRALLAGGRHETERTSWRVQLGTLPAPLAAEREQAASVVFWDPFSPRSNPALWTVAAFSALRRVCAADATVHTFSRSTATRAALLLAGFAVGTGPLTGPDKPTTIAAVDARALARPLDARWLDRLTRSSAPFPPDAPADALARIRAMSQFA
jgi:queuine tRNA-ribosyltransferase